MKYLCTFNFLSHYKHKLLDIKIILHVWKTLKERCFYKFKFEKCAFVFAWAESLQLHVFRILPSALFR